MAGENKCFSLVRGRAMRVTKLDGCGNPVPGADSTIVSDGFVSVALTANTEEGTTISVQNAAGKTCILDEPCPTFTGYSTSRSSSVVDPALFAMMAGRSPVLDGDGERGRVPDELRRIDACESGFALELWSNVPTPPVRPGHPGVNSATCWSRSPRAGSSATSPSATMRSTTPSRERSRRTARRGVSARTTWWPTVPPLGRCSKRSTRRTTCTCS
jgi:hypothetical protein